MLGAIAPRVVKFAEKEITRPMREPGSLPQIDPLLSSFLHAVDKEEEQEHLQQLLTHVDDILKKTTTDADEYQEALRQLIVALRNCKAHPNNNPIHNFRHYAATAAKHVRMGQKRAAQPEFTALKEELRRLLRADLRFALWRSEIGKQVCGLSEW